MENELPKYVNRFIDNRGTMRLRFRRTSYPSYYFKSKLGSERFNLEYEACLSGLYITTEEREIDKARALVASLYERDGVRHQSHVYAIGEQVGNAVKIGLARNITQRLIGLQIGNPRPLRLFAVRPGGRAEEKAAHIELRDHCIMGEWFKKPAVRRMFERDGVWLASPEVSLASKPQGIENAS